jgi:hypothetical protein
MACAVEEFFYVFLVGPDARDLNRLFSYRIMQVKMTMKERNDWFSMYKMGGNPYMHRDEISP